MYHYRRNKRVPSTQIAAQKLTCAVVNKSPLHPTKNGKMFLMNLCDESLELMLRAVCFNEDLFSKFEVSKAYDMSSFKIKKAFGDATSVEMLIDNELLVIPGTTQLRIVGCSTFKISEIHRGNTSDTRYINLKAKVMKIHEPDAVSTYPDCKTKREVNLADETGHIELILWAENVSFKTGDVLSLANVVVSSFNRQVNVTTSFETAISVVNEIMEVKEKPDSMASTSNVVSMTTTVMA